jgi:hypothetical protein
MRVISVEKSSKDSEQPNTTQLKFLTEETQETLYFWRRESKCNNAGQSLIWRSLTVLKGNGTNDDKWSVSTLVKNVPTAFLFGDKRDVIIIKALTAFDSLSRALSSVSCIWDLPLCIISPKTLISSSSAHFRAFFGPIDEEFMAMKSF